jgi:succinate-acetate transporter protein
VLDHAEPAGKAFIMAHVTVPNGTGSTRPNPETTAPPAAPTFAASIADPGPLGLGAFAMTTFVLSSANAGWMPASVTGVVLGLALFYGGIVQVFAGMWEFAKGNTFGALAFSSYGAFWLSFWYLVAHVDLTAAGSDASKGVGFFLLGWTIFTLYMLVAAVRTNTVLLVVFALLTLTFICLTWGALGDVSGITKLGGYLGLLTALGAWYGSMAGVVNATAKKVLLPVLPR